MSEEEIRLDQTKKVFEAIADIITNGSCTYRYLIYDMLSFKTEHYVDLMSGLTITNAIVDLEDFQQENKQLKEVIEEARKYIIEELLENDLEWERKKGGCISGSDLPSHYIIEIVDILDKVNNKD